MFSRLDLESLAIETSHCVICGCELHYGEKGGRCAANSPTLDRKDGKSVLDIHDVQITCLRCNTTKGPRSMREFVEYCKMVAQRMES